MAYKSGTGTSHRSGVRGGERWVILALGEECVESTGTIDYWPWAMGKGRGG